MLVSVVLEVLKLVLLHYSSVKEDVFHFIVDHSGQRKGRKEITVKSYFHECTISEIGLEAFTIDMIKMLPLGMQSLVAC